MSKAVLVLEELPESCEDCDLLDVSQEDGYPHCHIYGNRGSYDRRPDWCPLRELPKRKGSYGELPEYDTDKHYEIGWNACVDAIEKES